MFLLGKQYETCKSCQILKEQLSFERAEKKQLTETLIEIFKPKPIIMENAVELRPLADQALPFAKRRAALEQRDREEARILRDSKVVGKSDETVSRLETELGVSQNG